MTDVGRHSAGADRTDPGPERPTSGSDPFSNGRARWWWSVIVGVASVVAAVVIAAWPRPSAFVVAVIFALYLFTSGVYWMMTAAVLTDRDGGGRVLLAVLGIVATIVGLLCLRSPFQTLAVLTLLFGLFWVVGGLIEIVHTFSGPGPKGWGVASGLLSLVGGIVVLAFPFGSFVALTYTFAAVLLIYGALRVAIGVFIERGSSPAREPTPGTSRPATA